MSDRTEATRSRQAQSRKTEETSTLERPSMDAWSPANAITAIPDSGGYRHKWVRESVNGVDDPRNVQMHIAEGYERVKIENVPDGAFCEEDSKGDGLARWGGLVLMKLPIEFAKQRQDYYTNKAAMAGYAVDQLQGIAGKDAVSEDRGSRSIQGAQAGQELERMSKG